MSDLFETYSVIASIGLVMATVSFMSGLQVVKRDKVFGAMMTSMHRMNGYIASFIYVILATISLSGPGGVRVWSLIGWAVGLGLIIIKIIVVRNERYYKYGSRLGLLLFVTWLIIIYKFIVT